MTQPTNQVWLKTKEEKLKALLIDESKQKPMIENLLSTIRQLKAKNSFRIAILNQLLEGEEVDFGDDD